jgi:hypothetical protein
VAVSFSRDERLGAIDGDDFDAGDIEQPVERAHAFVAET